MAISPRAFAFTLAASIVAGCALVVHPETFGSTCRFSGDDSECGACVAARCQPLVDGCCRDEACSTTLAALEGCARSGDGRCDALKADRTSAVSSQANLASCVATRCSGRCASKAERSQSLTRCTESARSVGRACRCALSESPNDFECSAIEQPGSVCCAPAGWPAEGLECTCFPLDCVPSLSGCVCSLEDRTPEVSTCSGGICCAAPGGCHCRASACEPSQTRVASCSAREALCPDGQLRVERCSLSRED